MEVKAGERGCTLTLTEYPVNMKDGQEGRYGRWHLMVMSGLTQTDGNAILSDKVAGKVTGDG